MITELVSVIINSHNGAKYIKKSVNSALKQTYDNIEIIFWDNASNDKTKEVIAECNFDNRFKYYYSENFSKLYDAKEKAIKLAKGKYLAFLDVDDWWNENKLIKQISAMKKSGNLISCTNYFIYNEKKNKIKKIFKKNIDTTNSFETALKKYFVGMSTLIINREFYSSLEKGFDSSFEVIGDFDLVIRALKKKNILYISEPMSYYRWHNSNLSNRKFRLNIVELIRWRNNLNKKKFFSTKNLKIINDNLIYLILLYFKGNKKKIKFCLFIKKINSIKKRALLIILYFVPSFIIKALRS